MARRLELQGVCNDLLDSFVSRYNDLSGYWALGVFQLFLQENSFDELYFDLVNVTNEEKKDNFPQTSNYYRGALQRLLKTKNIPPKWVKVGSIDVQTTSPSNLICNIKLKTDLGRVFVSQRHVLARPFDPAFELRSGGKNGPGNQRGQ